MDKPKVLLIWNDSMHHKGSIKSEFWAKVLETDGFDVKRENSTIAMCDLEKLSSYDLVILSWSEEYILREQALILIDAITINGIGFAGYHETSTAFRQYDWHFLFGSFMATHPGLSSKGQKPTYTVHITKPDDPIMKGISDFEHTSEQFYLLHDGDNFNEVLADTAIAESDYPWLVGAKSPMVYKRPIGAGKIFYSSIGHFPEEFERDEIFKITHRGMLWASRKLPEGLIID